MQTNEPNTMASQPKNNDSHAVTPLPPPGSLGLPSRLPWQTSGQSPSAIVDAARSWNASVTPPRYVPQFSAATSLILTRMKGGSADFSSALSDASAAALRPDPDVFEDARSRLVQQMTTTTSTLPAPEPSNPGDTSLADIMRQGTKRKRESEDKDIDFSQSTIALPIQPAPASHQPPSYLSTLGESSTSSRTAMSVTGVCTNCGSSSSLTTNNDGTSNALCLQCANSAGDNALSTAPQPEDLRRMQKIERIRQTRLNSLPDGVVPAKPELVGFGPGAASDRSRTEYFSRMKKTDALNLLSFCDQLRPQLLVDVMVSISKRHPDLLIFNSPDWYTNMARQSASSKSHSNQKKASGRPPHGRSLLNSKAKQKIKTNIGKQPAVKRPQKRSQLAEEMVVENPEDLEDAPPPTWPRAGEGLYAKLVPETEDRGFLADENDEEAFSHFMVDKLGRQIIDPV